MFLLEPRATIRVGALLLVLVSTTTVTAWARTSPNGSLDQSFGRRGKTTTDFRRGDSRAYAVALEPDGKLVAVGESDHDHSAAFALARYEPKGALDTSFGSHGEVRTSFSVNATATAVAIRADGSILVAGPTGSATSTERRIAIARYLPDGRLDPSFGRNGRVMTVLEAKTVGVFLGASLVVEPSGKIIVAATTDSQGGGASRFGLAAYNANGSVDLRFGHKGLTTTGFGDDGVIATALALEPNGKLVAAGYTYAPTTYALQGFALARYTPQGSLDLTFGSHGEVSTVVGAASAAAVVAVQTDGRIIAGGSSFTQSNLQVRHFALVRYTPAGTLDPKFGNHGVVTTTFSGDDGVSGVAIESRGLVASGTTVSRQGGHSRFALARYLRNGRPDTTFGRGGKATTSFASGDAQAHDLIPDRTGRLVVAGEVLNNRTNSSAFALARYRR